MACRNGYHHQLHVCVVSLVLLLIAIVDGATYSQDVAYSLRAQSSFSRSYTADSHSTDNPCEKLSILHEIPLQSMMFFYTVINEVPFFMNTGGQIVVTLPSQVEYNAVLLQSYVKTFMLAFPTSIVEDNALQKTPDNDGNATREVVMDNSPSSSPNPSVMPTPQENDDNTQHIGTSVADTSSSSFSSSSGDTILNRYTTFFYFNRPRLSCLYNAPPIMKSLGLLPAGTFDSPIPMAILNKSAIVSNATFMQGCSSHIPPEQQLMPPSTDVLLTRSYMEMELDLQLKIFQYDVWEAMTSNAPRYSAQPSGSMSSSPDTVDGLIEENTHYGTYNLNRDPAKVCSAPAVYSMDLSPLYRVSTRGDSNTLGSNAVGPNVNITHLYPPALFVAVLVQCSSQPVAVDVRVVFSNPSGLGSAEFHLASMLYFVSLAAYILFAILFLFAIIPCWRISFTSPPAKDSAPTSDDRSSTTGRKGASTPKRSASNGRRSSGRRSGRRRHAQRSQSMSDAKKNSSVRYRSQNSSRDSPREELEADADDAHLAMPRSSHRHTPKTPSDIQHAVELEKRGKQPSPGGRSYSAPPSTRRTTLTSDCTSSGSDSDVSSNYRRRPTDGSNVGEMDESVARNIFPLFYTAVTRWWNPENVVIFVYPSLQWMLLSVMPFKIIVLVLRAAMFFYLSRDADTGFAYGLPTAAVVLMIYTSTFGFVMELLVGMGWGMAFKTLSTYKIVLVAISTTAMFILNVLSSTCGEGTISRIFIFVINPAISSQVGPRCVSLNIARGALLLFFYIHNVIQMILTVRALATHATNPAPSAEIRTSPLGYDKLFLRHVALPTDGQESETLRLQRTDSDHSNIDGQGDTQRSRSRRERADLDDPRLGSRASAKKATTSADKYLDPSSPEYATHTRHERASTASKFSADEIQIVIMDLHLRYHGLRFAFAGLPLLMLFYFTLALTMYEVQDYYMEVAFMELLQLYFFSLLLLFFRKEAFYC